MDDAAIVAFVKKEIEPVLDPIGFTSYRCAAYLSDGVYLPCVAIKSREKWTELATRRIAEEREASESASFFGRGKARANYASTVELFAASGNRVAPSAIARLEPSPFAIPARFLASIRTETSMSWTQFVATMRDGTRHTFATTHDDEFFAMPDGYTGEDIIAVDPHLREHADPLRDRPFFTCYVAGLP